MPKPRSLPNSEPRRRRRQERTVYTQEQLWELQSFFEKNKYPEYDERVALAARLHVQQHQVQVWFKNRRAKCARMLRQEEGQQLLGPGSQGVSALPEDPAFHSPPQPSLLASVLATEAAGCSPGQAWGASVQDAQRVAPAAPTPSCSQDAYASGFSPDPAACPDFRGLFSYQSPFSGPSLFPGMSESQADVEFVDSNPGNTNLLSL